MSVDIKFTAEAAKANRNRQAAIIIQNYLKAISQPQISFSFVDSKKEYNHFFLYSRRGSGSNCVQWRCSPAMNSSHADFFQALNSKNLVLDILAVLSFGHDGFWFACTKQGQIWFSNNFMTAYGDFFAQHIDVSTIICFQFAPNGRYVCVYNNGAAVACDGDLPAGLMARIVHVNATNRIKYVALGKQGWVVLYADGRTAWGGDAGGVPDKLVEFLKTPQQRGEILSVKMSMVKSDHFWIAFGNGDIHCSAEEHIYKDWKKSVVEIKQYTMSNPNSGNLLVVG